MRITAEQIRNIIKEELGKIYEQVSSNIKFKNLENLDDGGKVPAMHSDELIEVWGPTVEAFLYPDNIEWAPEVDDDIKDKIINNLNDDIEQLFTSENSNQFFHLLQSIDPDFQGIPKGKLAFSKEAITPIVLGYEPGSEIIVEGVENPKNQRKYEARLNNALGKSLGEFKVGDGYILDMRDDEYEHSTERFVVINLAKIIEDINSGDLKISLEEDFGEPIYKLVKY